MPVTAGRSVDLSTNIGAPLPEVGALRDLYKNKNHFYFGGLHLVVGRPKAMKSMFTLWLANQINLPTLYYSADSDAPTQTSRLAATRTGEPAWRIRQNVSEDQMARDYYAEALADSKLSFAYNPQPDANDIEHELSAYVELYDRFPSVIIVDNLCDMWSSGDSEFKGYKENLQFLKELARDTHAAVFVLHHARQTDGWQSKNKDDAQETFPAAASAVQGKVTQTPSMTLSVARDVNIFRLAVVNDRNAECDPTGRTYLELRVDPETCRFEYQPPLSAVAAAVAGEEKWW